MYYLNVTIFDSISYPKIFDRNVFRVRSTRISSILLVDSLSSASMFDFNLYPCASINISKYMFFDKYSLVPTTSVFVEVCIHLLFSGFLVNDSCSKSRYANCMTSHIRVYCMCWVNERQDSKQVPRSSKFLRPQLFVLANSFYRPICTNHPCVGSCFLYRGKDTDVSMSSLLLFITHNSFATNFTNFSACSIFNFRDIHLP